VGKKLEDYPYRSPERDDPIKRWLTIGRMTAKKGHPDSIAAFHRVAARHPESTLRIIGDGPLYGQVKEYIQQNRLEERVHLLGEMPHDQVKHELTVADAFILCSKTAPNGDREGVPTVLMEAQAIGLPCVSTWHSGIPEVIPEKNQWLLAEEGNVTEIANRMERLMKISGDQLRRVVRRGRLKIETDFNLTKEAEKARDLMAGLMCT
jgi:glycosyltransferase involved in cell wall biosynthesis